ncbi:hypothetical protein GCM10025876_03590 [Demequina litorisediminis]|uniref:Uncharacterized protein n=1 Tax=Demequina litorisediminis TaxID=1849022 RepID=A0ABQ6I9Z6_9MICO|nr:hypothetical protein GCM10025876_03590 [Demequina litorisediminis]
MVAGIRDRAIQPEYARLLAGWLGMEVEVVRRMVADASRGSRGGGQGRGGGQAADAWGGPGGYGADAGPGPARPDRRDPVVRAEALSLGTLLQAPSEITQDRLASAVVGEPAARGVHGAAVQGDL